MIAPAEPKSRGKRTWLRVLAVVFLIILGLVGFTLGKLGHLLTRRPGEWSGAAAGGLRQTLSNGWQVAFDPRAGFPGQNRLTILCMGIDDNWTDSDVVYTAKARTDTLFLLTLDLDTQKVSMLSIPRDTYAHIAGTHWNFKINSAYETGGPQRAVATVGELLGVHADHYLVLNIDATRKIVDALGGVDLDVPHEMHYHDKWGHLSIDLHPGFQHLSGDQAVGFARYRHPDAGAPATPEDGDDRRIFRQHTLLRAMIARAKTFDNATQVDHLMDVAMSTIRTDLSRTQLFDLANLFHGIQPDSVRTAMLPGDDFRGPTGAWFYRIDPDRSRALVDWLVRDDETRIVHQTPIIVENGTAVPDLARSVVARLRQSGYAHVINGGNAPPPANAHMAGVHTPYPPHGRAAVSMTHILDTGVDDPNAPSLIAHQIGLLAPVSRRLVQPNRVGWTPPAAVTVVLGQDYAAAAKAAAEPGGPPPIDSDNAPVPTGQS